MIVVKWSGLSWGWVCGFFFFQAEDGIRDVERSRGLGDVYKRQAKPRAERPRWQFRLARNLAIYARLSFGRDGLFSLRSVRIGHPQQGVILAKPNYKFAKRQKEMAKKKKKEEKLQRKLEKKDDGQDFGEDSDTPEQDGEAS
eukprot:TRINITY_DN13922_c0_g1_i2.p4 TRINITY_DN13922_c0_g1~~TRINITY_DN13922_c0_g1_i2.p4  ORF type:complete len:142 (+),score=38.42 TRINITY_DN13922_c0_g1_i2:22-447(+)